MTSNSLEDVAIRVAAALGEDQCVLIGGLAVGAHGYVRATTDVGKSAHDKHRARFEEIFPSAIDMVLSSAQDLKALIAEFSRFSRLPEVRLDRCHPRRHGGT